MGHVNNAVYFTYFEEARSQYWISLFEVDHTNPAHPASGSIDFKKLGFVVVHAECNFASSAGMGEPLLIGARIPEIRRTSFVFEYRIISGGETKSDADARLIASGRTVQALFDWATRTTIPITDDLRRRIEVREGISLRAPTRSGLYPAAASIG